MMATQPAPATINPGIPLKREWGTAFSALRKLLTVPGGGRLAFEHVELAQRLTDRSWIDTFADGTVGAAYRNFLDSTGYSADGLVEISMAEGAFQDVTMAHPYAWMGRRERDIHDIWHVLTGYKADEHLGEACLVAFSYAQTGGAGWAFIGLGAALKSLRITGETLFFRAVIEGYRNGKRASWLHAEDYEALLAEPIDAARARLGIVPATVYTAAQARLEAQGLKGI